MLEFVDSDLYFVQDKKNFKNPLLHVGSGSVEKSTGSGSGGPKITGSGSSSLPSIQHQILISFKVYKLDWKVLPDTFGISLHHHRETQIL